MLRYSFSTPASQSSIASHSAGVNRKSPTTSTRHCCEEYCCTELATIGGPQCHTSVELAPVSSAAVLRSATCRTNHCGPLLEYEPIIANRDVAARSPTASCRVKIVISPTGIDCPHLTMGLVRFPSGELP